MTIQVTDSLNKAQEEALHDLWNSEYPKETAHKDIAGLEAYLNGLGQCRHYLLKSDAGGGIDGWASTFDREGERWFAIIIDNKHQRKGFGSLLLDRLKQDEQVLNGWITEGDLLKVNGEAYLSPLAFYQRNGFKVHRDITYKHNSLLFVKISWLQAVK